MTMHTNINTFRHKKFCCEAHKFTRERPQRLVRHTSKEVADMAEEAKALGYKLEPTESVKTRLEDKARELGFHLVPRSAHDKTGKMQILATKPIGGGNLEVSFSFSVFSLTLLLRTLFPCWLHEAQNFVQVMTM